MEQGLQIETWEAAAEVLGVAPDAEESDVRRAYLRLIREHPPDADPVQFERIRDAHAFMSDPYRRTNQLFDVDPLAPLETVVDEPCRVGLEPWIEAIKEMVRP